ncbi:hypothetical protein [Nissabacter sp. SGAir0207]|uniref:hypothetical protein n=1 Tax=Nissabacter sp. SGAir0207 TaxID=2126321 RepID=UPI0010F5A442|nr:hypothetical protein [Nissabacter sp. SGAir0207]
MIQEKPSNLPQLTPIEALMEQLPEGGYLAFKAELERAAHELLKSYGFEEQIRKVRFLGNELYAQTR